MIEFSRNSWHYRAADFYSHHGVPTSLCPYVRAAVSGGLIWTIAMGIMATLAFTSLASLAVLVTGGYWSALPMWIQVGGVVTLTIACVIGFIFCLEKYQEWKNKRRYAKWEAEYQAKRDGGEYIPPQPSLLRLYWNAVHDKLCPTITFKSNDTADPEAEQS